MKYWRVRIYGLEWYVKSCTQATALYRTMKAYVKAHPNAVKRPIDLRVEPLEEELYRTVVAALKVNEA